MTDAVGIHTHPTYALGVRPNNPAKPRLFFKDFALTDLPAYPVVNPAPDLVWPMDRNDIAGDCVVAALDHCLQAIYGQLGVSRATWDDAELLAMYQTQNPGFRSWDDAGGPDDQGMVIQDFLAFLVREQVILGFAAVDSTNEQLTKAAMYLGLSLVTGETLQVAQQSQTDRGVWTYKKSAVWGGHCTPWVGYLGSPDYDTTVTWGMEVEMTQSFIQHQVTEAWFVLTQAHVDNTEFRDSFDLAAFAAAYTAVTGRPFPVVTPPTPGTLTAAELANGVRDYFTSQGV